MTLFYIGKKAVFLQFIEKLSNNINMSLAWILDIDEDVM